MKISIGEEPMLIFYKLDLRNADGESPVFFEKNLENARASKKPTAEATSETESELSDSKRFASETLQADMYSFGDTFRLSLNTL